MEQEILFNKEDVEYILSKVTSFELATITYGDDKSFIKPSYRQSYISESIDDELKNFLVTKLSKFGVKSISTGTVNHYGEGCYFKPHVDRTPTYSNRHKTVVVQLSSPEDYSGGEMIVKEKLFHKDLGNTIIFDSGFMHEVKKVIDGDRYSLVLWLENHDLVIQKSLL